VIRHSLFRRRLWATAAIGAVAALCAAAPPASAQDMVHGFVEPCTMSNVAEQHLDCQVCASGFGSRACEEKLKPRGFTKKCRTHGTHTGWDEIWCAPRPIPESTSKDTWVLFAGAAAMLGAMALVMRVILGKPAKG
jgi:hypothetical protein